MQQQQSYSKTTTIPASLTVAGIQTIVTLFVTAESQLGLMHEAMKQVAGGFKKLRRAGSVAALFLLRKQSDTRKFHIRDFFNDRPIADHVFLNRLLLIPASVLTAPERGRDYLLDAAGELLADVQSRAFAPFDAPATVPNNEASTLYLAELQRQILRRLEVFFDKASVGDHCILEDLLMHCEGEAREKEDGLIHAILFMMQFVD